MTDEKESVPFEPMELADIEALLESNDFETLEAQKTNVLKSIGHHRLLQRNENAKYANEQTFEPVIEVIEQFLEQNSLAIVPFYDFSRIGVTLCDKEDYRRFQSYERRPEPIKRWDEFDQLQELIHEVADCKIIGSFENGKLVYNLIAMPPVEYREKMNRLDAMSKTAMSVYREIGKNKLQKAEQLEQAVNPDKNDK